MTPKTTNKGRDKMSKIHLNVCVCPCCVMAGAMDILAEAEGLKKQIDVDIAVRAVKCFPAAKHDVIAPVIYFRGEMIENASAQTVMAKIFADERGGKRN